MARINVTISESARNRLVTYAADRDISQGDVVEDALKKFL